MILSWLSFSSLMASLFAVSSSLMILSCLVLSSSFSFCCVSLSFFCSESSSFCCELISFCSVSCLIKFSFSSSVSFSFLRSSWMSFSCVSVRVWISFRVVSSVLFRSSISEIRVSRFFRVSFSASFSFKIDESVSAFSCCFSSYSLIFTFNSSFSFMNWSVISSISWFLFEISEFKACSSSEILRQNSSSFFTDSSSLFAYSSSLILYSSSFAAYSWSFLA